jgi:hypothetical protein
MLAKSAITIKMLSGEIPFPPLAGGGGKRMNPFIQRCPDTITATNHIKKPDIGKGLIPTDVERDKRNRFAEKPPWQIRFPRVLKKQNRTN